MRSEIEQGVQLLQRADEAALEQALALLQNTVFSFSMRVLPAVLSLAGCSREAGGRRQGLQVFAPDHSICILHKV